MANARLIDFMAGGGGHMIVGQLDGDDPANTLTLTVTHTKFDGSAQRADPRKAWFTVKINSGVDLTVDLLTGKVGISDRAPDDPAAVLTNPQDFSQASPGVILNAGAKTRTGVRASISPNRAAATAFSVQYTPPA